MESMEAEAGVPSETYSGSQVCHPRVSDLAGETFTNNSKGVYIYRPADAGKAHGERPLKKRKVTQEPKPPSEDTCPFVPLLDGNESEQSIKLRYQTYEQLWSVQEAKIQASTYTCWLHVALGLTTSRASWMR